MAFKELLRAAGLSPDSAARYLDVHPTTIRRYLKDGAPVSVIEALKYRAGHVYGWEGFRVSGTHLLTPNGESLHRELLDQYSYHVYLVHEQGRLARQRLKLPSRPDNLAFLPGYFEALERRR